MRLIKVFLAGALGLFLVITLLSLLIPSQVKVSRTVLINNVSEEKVLEQVAVFSNWKNWHPIFKTTDVKMTAIPAAASQHAAAEILYGTKSAKLTLMTTDSHSIRFMLQSPGENDIQNQLVVSKIPGQQNVQVEWRALNSLKWYPWEKFYGIFIDKLTGPGYEEALKGLKDYLETGR